MNDKILGVVCFALSAACQGFLPFADAANFYAIVFFVLGAYEFLIGILRQRRAMRTPPAPARATES